MKKLSLFILTFGILTTSFGQTLETVYLNPKDSSSNMFIAVKPENVPVKAFMFCIPGAFQTPQYVLQQTNLPMYAAKQGILTIIPIFSTGLSSLGFDSLTQQSLKGHTKCSCRKISVAEKRFLHWWIINRWYTRREICRIGCSE